MTATKRCAVALLASCALGACASVPAPQRLPQLRSAPSYVVALRPPAPSPFPLSMRPLDREESVLYFQNFGGGGALLGLLSPLGALLNAFLVEWKTASEAEALQGKVPLDPLALFSEISAEYPTLRNRSQSGGPAGPEVRLSPWIQLVKRRGSVLQLGCSLSVEYRRQHWRGHYVYQSALEYPQAELEAGLAPAQLETLARDLRAGFRTLTDLYLADASGALRDGPQIWFRSRFVTPRFVRTLPGYELSRGPGRIQIRSADAVYSFPEAALQILPRPAPGP